MKVVKVRYKERSVQFDILSMNVHKNGILAKSLSNTNESTKPINKGFVDFLVLK